MSLFFDTPILFLIFNRPDVTKRIFEQIRTIKPRYLYIAADGPRPGREDDLVNCRLTREIFNQIDWVCELKTLFRNENLGCGYAVCSSISWFFEQEEEGIILEDDCFPDLSFFQFCQELLDKYKDDEKIYLISGTNMQNGIKRGTGSYYFSNYPITWGWASWRRAWKDFSYEMPDFEKSFISGDFDHLFASTSEKFFWRKKLRKVKSEKKHIWDYQWFYAIWKNGGISIIPNVNLIINLGFRNKALHTFLKDSIREPTIVNSIKFPLIHSRQKIDHIADLYTYKNVFSHSIARLSRLTKENGIYSILKYTALKFLFKI
ncbi:MAG: nucleotide-diphospho-sugar transferase [Bacteroidota bacterium]|nr:nucleotide-diphospho-sugar transferase [Bacteroidota bacterium]